MLALQLLHQGIIFGIGRIQQKEAMRDVTFTDGTLGLRIDERRKRYPDARDSGGERAIEIVELTSPLGQAALGGCCVGDQIRAVNNELLPSNVTCEYFKQLVAELPRPVVMTVATVPTADPCSKQTQWVSVGTQVLLL